MQCERCKKTDATIHLTEIIKDVKSEVHLCEGCARDIGLNSKLSNYSLSVPEMLSFLEVRDVEESEESGACKTCGTSFVQYMKEGKLGCSDCYEALASSLASVIKGYHGNKKHIGKIPLNYEEKSFQKEEIFKRRSREVSLQELRVELERAIDDERYEEAANLRDKINEAIRG